MSDWKTFLWNASRLSLWPTILFDICINDIDESLNSKILKFADDTKIYSKVNLLDGTKESTSRFKIA